MVWEGLFLGKTTEKAGKVTKTDAAVVFCFVLWMKDFEIFIVNLGFFYNFASIAVGMVRSFRLNFCTKCGISPRLRLIEE